MEKDTWRDEWLEIHYAERMKAVARIALEAEYRRYEWWDNLDGQQPETD